MAALLEHLQRSGEPVRAGVARCTATLLASDPERRLSAPTALAQAERLAEEPDAGAALIQLYESLMTLVHLARSGWGRAGLHRGALRETLGYLAVEMHLLIELLGETR